MANLGLLGALQGLGEGIQTVGKGMELRRERALENARKMAEEQRRRAERQEDRTDTQEFQRKMQGERLDRSDKANQARIDASAAGRKEAQANQVKMVGVREASQRRLADYRSGLALSRSAANRDAQRQIDAGEIVDVKPGNTEKRPDGQQRTQVLHVRRDGTVMPTNQWVTPSFFKTPTQNFGRAKSGDEDDLSLLPEDDEEEE